jgi:hypothetical protein
MKNILLISIIALGDVMPACNKGDKLTPLLPSSSFTFSAGDSLINFSINKASIEDVYNTHTTLITGQYEDTSSRKGSSGKQYYNTKDSDNAVTIDKYVKKYNGTVSGSFTIRVANGPESIRLNQGIFSALYQE